MDAQSLIYDVLATDQTITELVGDRIYPVVADQNLRPPFMVMQELEINEIATKDGPIPDGWGFQIDLYADNYNDIRSMKKAVRSALNWKVVGPPGGRIRTKVGDNTDAPFLTPSNLFQYVVDCTARVST
ncbi:tail completion protein gp17 [Neolewinella antarctica]|uniref:DUF3168 domain-containing protein n=1 Tax=Neolewinella antarctica TaxID=442734 RepID=A0ABX0X735_9BACT|nr:DUF3168 domain-containing protein [Neolewinella antarctica]NJC24799.1 hypothetical protein [Neolewinella antarctica]